MIATMNETTPEIDDTAYIVPNSSIIGAVTIGSDSSVWPCASVRADSDTITIGDRTSIQDNAVLHTAKDFPVRVGDNVTIGHNAIVHGCTVEDEVLVGMGAIILSGATIGKHSIVAAGALVPEGTEIPPNSVVMGIPGKIVRETTEADVKQIRENAQVYVEKAARYQETFEILE